MRRSSYAWQRGGRSNLDDSAGVLSAGQANLLDGEIAETGARVYLDRNNALCIGDRHSREDALEIVLHGLSRSPAGTEYPKGILRILADELVSCTHESLPGTYRCAFRTGSFRRRRTMRERPVAG